MVREVDKDHGGRGRFCWGRGRAERKVIFGREGGEGGVRL